MIFTEQYLRRAAKLITLCRATEDKIATAESCTGGLLAALITAIPGSSEVFDRGFVTYSNAAKIECLDVPLEILELHGAVSRETALAMAQGALTRSNASIALSITGIAGPGGGTPQKPVGLVHLCLARKGGLPWSSEKRFGDIGRDSVRNAAVAAALELLFEVLG